MPALCCDLRSLHAASAVTAPLLTLALSAGEQVANALTRFSGFICCRPSQANACEALEITTAAVRSESQRYRKRPDYHNPSVAAKLHNRKKARIKGRIMDLLRLTLDKPSISGY